MQIPFNRRQALLATAALGLAGGAAAQSSDAPLHMVVTFPPGGSTDIAARIKAGVVWVNCANVFDAGAGFGGYRESGFGREGGREGMAAYLAYPAPAAKNPEAAPAAVEPTPAAAARESASSRERPICAAINSTAASAAASTSDLPGM